MSLLDDLPHLCDAYPLVTSQGDYLGSQTARGTATFTGRDCWHQPLTSREVAEYQKPGIEATGKLYFAFDPGLDERHVVVVGGTEYDVLSRPMPDCMAGMSAAWKVVIGHKTGEDAG